MDSILTYTLVSFLIYAANVPTVGWTVMLLGTMQYIPAFTLAPRFILNLRELYARDVGGRDGSDVDTAFGLTSTISHGDASMIMFADLRQDEGEQSQGEEI